MTDLNLIDWTIEETNLLKAERSQLSEVDPIPSLGEILIWPTNDFSRRPVEPTDTAAKDVEPAPGTAPNVPATTSVVDPVRKQVASDPPVAASETYSISTSVREARPPSSFPDAIVKSDVPATTIDRDRMISLRWALRDIRSNRLDGSPVNQYDLQTLIEMDLVQIGDGSLVLTTKGESAVNLTGFQN